MKRIAAYTTALLFTLSTLPSLRGGANGPSKHSAKSENVHQESKANLTIVFHGLMVLHPDPAGQYFEAGLLRTADHGFRIKVSETLGAAISTFQVPLGSFSGFLNDVWSFEFTNSSKRGVHLYQNGSFDRKADIGDSRDFRWAVDLEGKEFYNEQLTTKANQLGVLLRVTNGEFYTKTKTAPLMRNQGNGTFQYFGSAANEIATDLFLEAGDVVLRSAKAKREIFRLHIKTDATYEILVENEPLTDAHIDNVESGDHFRYYYQLITKPKLEWYEFKLASEAALTPSESDRFIYADYIGPTTPGTLKTPCMMAGVGKRKTPLNELEKQ